MANVSVYNMEGNEVGTLELNDAVFGVEVNEHLVHLAVVAQLAAPARPTARSPSGSSISCIEALRTKKASASALLSVIS